MQKKSQEAERKKIYAFSPLKTLYFCTSLVDPFPIKFQYQPDIFIITFNFQPSIWLLRVRASAGYFLRIFSVS